MLTNLGAILVSKKRQKFCQSTNKIKNVSRVKIFKRRPRNSWNIPLLPYTDNQDTLAKKTSFKEHCTTETRNNQLLTYSLYFGHFHVLRFSALLNPQEIIYSRLKIRKAPYTVTEIKFSKWPRLSRVRQKKIN